MDDLENWAFLVSVLDGTATDTTGEVLRFKFPKCLLEETVKRDTERGEREKDTSDSVSSPPRSGRFYIPFSYT